MNKCYLLYKQDSYIYKYTYIYININTDDSIIKWILGGFILLQIAFPRDGKTVLTQLHSRICNLVHGKAQK